MNNKNKITLLLFLIIPFLLPAQADKLINSACYTDQLHQQMLNENTRYKEHHESIELQLYKLQRQSTSSLEKLITTQAIPVVVHVIHENGPENISNAQVFEAIQHLNEAFANTGFYDQNTGVDTEIQFCLANRDPQNNLSNGINRIESPLTNVTMPTQDLSLKSLLQWNPLDYLNIWVVNEISSLYSGPGVVGYAYLPTAHGLPVDGIVIEASFFGLSQDNSKVLVHEAGHYLGLYHTFEGACFNDDCQLNGDRVCDTPPDQSTAPVECGDNINTCNTDEDDSSSNNPFRSIQLGGSGDQNDMYINYMDYGLLSCYSAFTEGQKYRMQNALLNVRGSLLESFGCQDPCSLASFDASFNSNFNSPIMAGQLVTFTNTSDPAESYEWTIGDVFISNDMNISYAFDIEGTFKVNLTIRDTVNNCENSFEEIIEVFCAGEASFTTTNTEISPGETLSFTNTSTGNSSYQWILDGALYSTDQNISITFLDPGYYSIYLIGETQNCLNYSSTINIQVGVCTAENKSEMHWYFGTNSALDFNSGEPVAITDSELEAREGTASISDSKGNLLFYTNGLSVWDATNTVMPNGSDLMGGPTTSTSDQCLIIPRPHRQGQYYVFTCDEMENDHLNGIRYSIIDMSLNDGRGDVTNVKNVFLCEAIVEFMSAAYHDDGHRSWLVIPEYDKLNTYLIDTDGVYPTASFSDLSFGADWKNLRFFNNGRRLVSIQDKFDDHFLAILDFNNKNGTFSNPIKINTINPSIWSFEVSPDDRKLYCITLVNGDWGLYQYNLSLTTGSQIANSITLVGNLSSAGEILRGPNGKIYITTWMASSLSVINDPNQEGIQCDFESDFMDLSPASNILSLPKYIRGNGFTPFVELGPDQTMCNGTTTILDPGADENYNFLWHDGSTDPTYTAWLPGNYWVTVSNQCGSFTDSLMITLDSDAPLVSCPSNIDTLVPFGTIAVLLSPEFPDITDSCPYTYLNDFTNTNDATSNYPIGTTTITWTATDDNGNSATCEMDIDVEIMTGTEDLENIHSSLILYPNPSNGLFTLEETQINEHEIHLSVFDPLGQKVYSKSVTLSKKVKIDLSDQNSGVYFLQWSTKQNSGVFKLILGH